MNQKPCPLINLLLEEARLELENRKLWDIWKKLPHIHHTGKIWSYVDHIKGFILLSRWMYAVEWIKKTKAYKENATFYGAYMSIDQINKVKSALTELAKLLTTRYSTKLTEAVIQKDRCHRGWKWMPETPFDEMVEAEPEDFISCIQLFQQMQCNNRYLIIDIRPKEDYVTSRIKSQKCINIPERELHFFGQVLQTEVLGEFLLKEDENMFTLYQQRSSQYIDRIILMDWHTTRHTLIEYGELHILRTNLRQWDSKVTDIQIAILDGGFSEWLNRYPAYTTNPNLKDANNEANTMDEIFEEVAFPVWLNSDDDRSPLKHLNIEPLPTKKSNCNDTNVSYADEKSMQRHRKESIDLAATPSHTKNRLNDSTNENNLQDSIQNSYESLNDQKSKVLHLPQKSENRVTEKIHFDEDVMTLQTAKLPDVITNPIVNKSCKRVNVLKKNSDCTALLSLMSKLLELLKYEVQFEKRILSIEYERSRQSLMENEDHNYHSEAQFTLLQDKLAEVRSKKSKIRIALAKPKFEDYMMSDKEAAEKAKLDFSIGSMKQRLKTISIDRKKLHEKIATMEEKQFAAKQTRNNNNLHNKSLNLETSSKISGIKRSHSSPNLSQVKKFKIGDQLDDRKISSIGKSSNPQSEIHTPSNTKPNIDATYSVSTSRDPEQQMDPVFRDTYPGITGLKNLGNSCYMNSIIQCLSNTALLTRYFTDNVYLDDLNTSNDNDTHGHVAEEVAQVIKALWRGHYKSISPRDLKGVIGQYKLQFDTYEQQDSHEFLTFLLHWMHNDLKKNVKIRVDGPLSTAQKEWDKTMETQESIISRLFFGQLKSNIRCTICGNSSTTYENFNSLTMSLPHSNRCTLDNCIQKYVSGQTVSGWKCPNCKLQRDAVKKFDFVKLAPIIVIHLNRFAKSEGWLEKNNTSVEFPLTDFNLKPYLVTDTESVNILNQSQNYNYSLYAVSNHYGTMHGGHYTAFCKSATQNKWYKYDDRTVNEVSPSQVKCQSTSAYLLFYTSFPYEPYTFI